MCSMRLMSLIVWKRFRPHCSQDLEKYVLFSLMTSAGSVTTSISSWCFRALRHAVVVRFAEP
jgi:hypothetical protein